MRNVASDVPGWVSLSVLRPHRPSFYAPRVLPGAGRRGVGSGGIDGIQAVGVGVSICDNFEGPGQQGGHCVQATFSHGPAISVRARDNTRDPNTTGLPKR